jgi:hypothetical protein
MSEGFFFFFGGAERGDLWGESLYVIMSTF